MSRSRLALQKGQIAQDQNTATFALLGERREQDFYFFTLLHIAEIINGQASNAARRFSNRIPE
ncbi:MAG: hypothetical protein JO097_06500 [Acidobacteriaceae bacterium]|nr:hypothetical protein [Acidobacteriaceae bacterium]MBV9294673.1 hypothetical protein [Acidobacteriaceae bacterium]